MEVLDKFSDVLPHQTGHSIFAALGKQVSRGTAQRRNKLIDIAVEYKETLPDGIRTHVEGPHMNANSYQQLLLDSKFTLCPGGHNPETFRMFEALEAGWVSHEYFLRAIRCFHYSCLLGQIP